MITQNYARLSKEAAANNQSYQDYLLELLDGEVLQRDENAQKLRLARARFPVIKMLDSFDFTALPSLNKALVIELTRGNFVDRRENVIFIGSYGTGNYRKNLLMERFSELDLNMYQSFPKIFP